MDREAMRNRVDYDIAATQGDLFEYASREGYEMEGFITRYMNDPFTAQAMDTLYSPFQIQPPHILLSYLPEVAASKKGGRANPDAMWWIGYAYRLLCRKKGLASRDAVGALPPGLMAAMYPGYHTILNDECLLERLYADYRAGKQRLNNETTHPA